MATKRDDGGPAYPRPMGWNGSTHHFAKERAKLAARLVAEWNSKHAIGTEVEYWNVPGGEVKRSKTTTAAEIVGGHSAVIFLDGVRGYWAVSHIRPAEHVHCPACSRAAGEVGAVYHDPPVCKEG